MRENLFDYLTDTEKRTVLRLQKKGLENGVTVIDKQGISHPLRFNSHIPQHMPIHGHGINAGKPFTLYELAYQRFRSLLKKAKRAGILKKEKHLSNR